MGKLAATLADKIFKGAPAGSLPVVTAELSLRINIKRAREIGLTVPEGMLHQANELIK